MKVLRRLQPWQTILLQHPIPIRIVPFQQLAIMPAVRGETGIEAVVAEAEAEEGGPIEAKEKASALRTQGSVARRATWAGASICT